jgi:hypothetical protein
MNIYETSFNDYTPILPKYGKYFQGMKTPEEVIHCVLKTEGKKNGRKILLSLAKDAIEKSDERKLPLYQKRVQLTRLVLAILHKLEHHLNSKQKHAEKVVHNVQKLELAKLHEKKKLEPKAPQKTPPKPTTDKKNEGQKPIKGKVVKVKKPALPVTAKAASKAATVAKPILPKHSTPSNNTGHLTPSSHRAKPVILPKHSTPSNNTGHLTPSSNGAKPVILPNPSAPYNNMNPLTPSSNGAKPVILPNPSIPSNNMGHLTPNSNGATPSLLPDFHNALPLRHIDLPKPKRKHVFLGKSLPQDMMEAIHNPKPLHHATIQKHEPEPIDPASLHGILIARLDEIGKAMKGEDDEIASAVNDDADSVSSESDAPAPYSGNINGHDAADLVNLAANHYQGSVTPPSNNALEEWDNK